MTTGPKVGKPNVFYFLLYCIKCNEIKKHPRNWVCSANSLLHLALPGAWKHVSYLWGLVVSSNKPTEEEEVDEVSFDVFHALSSSPSYWSSCSGHQHRKRFLPDVLLEEKYRETGPKVWGCFVWPQHGQSRFRRLFVAVRVERRGGDEAAEKGVKIWFYKS